MVCTLCKLSFLPGRLDRKNFVCKFEGFDELAALAFASAEVEEKVNTELIEGRLCTTLEVATGAGRGDPSEGVMISVCCLANQVLLKECVAIL